MKSPLLLYPNVLPNLLAQQESARQHMNGHTRTYSWDNVQMMSASAGEGINIITAQLRREEDPGNARKPLTVPSYNLDNCPFICKVLFMKTSIQLRNKRQSFCKRSV